MDQVIVKNTTGAKIRIGDLFDIGIAAGVEKDLRKYFTYVQLAESNNLKDLLASGTLTLIQDGVELSAIEGINYVDAVSTLTLVSGLAQKSDINHTHPYSTVSGFLGLYDTPDIYPVSETYYVKATTSGISFIRESSFIATQAAVTSNYNVTSDQTITYIDATSNDIYIYMATPSTLSGKILWFKRTDLISSNNVYIVSDGSFYIEGEEELKLRCRDCYTLSSDGIDYWII